MKEVFRLIRASTGGLLAVTGMILAAAGTVHAAASCGTILTNIAQVNWYTEFSRTVTLTPPSSTAYVTVTDAAYTATKDWINESTGSKSLPTPGQMVQYSIRVVNTNNFALNGMLITDTLPTQMSVDVASVGAATVWSGSTPIVNGGWVYDYEPTNRIVIATQTPLDVWGPGQSRTFYFNAMVDFVCFNEPVMNTAFVFFPGGCSGGLTAQTSLTAMPANPEIMVTKDWVNKATGLKTPLPTMGSEIRYTVTVENISSGTAANIIIVDTLPTISTRLLAFTWNSSTVYLSASGTGGELLGVVYVPELAPAAKGVLIADVRVNTLATGGFNVLNKAFAEYRLKGCVEAATLYTEEASVLIPITSPTSMIVKVYNSAGELVRAFPPLPVGKAPTDFRFTYTTTGDCPTWVEDFDLPFSPDEDCVNDVLKLTFDELLDENDQPYSGIWWDGRNDQGEYVNNGEYVVVVESTDAQSGEVVVVSKAVTLSAKRSQVFAKIFNSAGEEVATLPTASISTIVSKIWVEPNPFEPDIQGTNYALIKLFDSSNNLVDTLRWYGRTCPSAADRICPSPTSGQIVNNGVYTVQVLSIGEDGEQTVVTQSLIVSHGKIELISGVQAVPNPMSVATLARADARMWIRYVVAGGLVEKVDVKIYNVAGELIQRFDATSQDGPADPLGRSASSINCPAGQVCGTFFWTGRNDKGTVCTAGLYLVVIEVTDASGNKQREVVKVALQ